jgi:hypothetical protein
MARELDTFNAALSPPTIKASSPMAVYEERFPVGTRVRVASRESLDRFALERVHHHPLTSEQIACAGLHAIVEAVGFYHGGDVLYELSDLPGTWHEACLESVDPVSA